MANVFEPTEEQRADWADWVNARPEPIRQIVKAHQFAPWKLYRMRSSGHRVEIYSFEEQSDPSKPVTLSVNVTGQFNAVAFERTVFGVSPDDLEECDLPKQGEVLGVMLTPAQAADYVRSVREPS